MIAPLSTATSVKMTDPVVEARQKTPTVQAENSVTPSFTVIAKHVALTWEVRQKKKIQNASQGSDERHDSQMNCTDPPVPPSNRPLKEDLDLSSEDG